VTAPDGERAGRFVVEHCERGAGQHLAQRVEREVSSLNGIRGYAADIAGRIQDLFVGLLGEEAEGFGGVAGGNVEQFSGFSAGERKRKAEQDREEPGRCSAGTSAWGFAHGGDKQGLRVVTRAVNELDAPARRFC
jgi:hypothetical protein